MNTFLWILLALNILAAALAGIRAHSRRIEEERFFHEYKSDDWADR